MNRVLSIAVAVSSLFLAACGSSPQANIERIEEARRAISAGEYDRAKSLCDDVRTSSSAKELSAAQLGELAIIYMQLSDCEDMEDNTPEAYQCYHNAWKVNADSAQAFFSSVAGEDLKYVQMLSLLMQAIENPDKNNIEEHTDILPEEDSH